MKAGQHPILILTKQCVTYLLVLMFGVFSITYLFSAYSVIVWCLILNASLQQKANESWKMFLAILFRFNWVTGRQSAASRHFEMKHTLANYCEFYSVESKEREKQEIQTQLSARLWTIWLICEYFKCLEHTWTTKGHNSMKKSNPNKNHFLVWDFSTKYNCKWDVFPWPFAVTMNIMFFSIFRISNMRRGRFN